jgi:hypothetical protein
MIRSIFSLLAILIASLATIIIIIPESVNAESLRSSMKGFQSHWLANTNQDRNELLRKWLENKGIDTSPESRSVSAPFKTLSTNSEFKGKWNSFHN